MTNQLTKILGFNLRNYLKLAGVSQAFLAKRIKRVPLTIYNYLSGKTLPDLQTTNRIRAEFGFEKLAKLPEVKKASKPAKKTKKAGLTVVKIKTNVYQVKGKKTQKVALTKKTKAAIKNAVLFEPFKEVKEASAKKVDAQEKAPRIVKGMKGLLKGLTKQASKKS